MHGLSTWCRHPGAGAGAAATPDGFAAWAGSLGASGVVIESSVDEGFLEPLIPALLTRGLPIVAVEAPLAGTGPRGTRVPWLATADREERHSAVVAIGETLRRAAGFGTTLVVLRLGALAIR